MSQNTLPCTYFIPTHINNEVLSVFSLIRGLKHLSLLFNILLEVLARGIRQEKEVKGIQMGNK